MIKFNLGIKELIIKFKEFSNAFKLSEQIAFNYNLSDKKKSEIHTLILNRLKMYKKMVGDSEEDSRPERGDSGSLSKTTIKSNVLGTPNPKETSKGVNIYKRDLRSKMDQLKLSMDRIDRLIQIENLQLSKEGETGNNSENDFTSPNKTKSKSNCR